MSQQPSGIDLARAALAAARASAKTRPTQPQKKTRSRARATDRRQGDPMAFGAAITGMMAARGWQPPETGGSILDQWPTIAPELADKVAAVRFEHDTGTLHLRPATHTYATQLRLYQAQILAKVQQSPTGTTVRSLKILPPGTAAAAPGDTVNEPEAPREPAPVQTRETASSGFREALGLVLENRPAAPLADPYIEQARQRQIAALRANRQPQAAHRDAEWEIDRLKSAEVDRSEAVRRAAIARKRQEQAGTAPTPRRAFDVA